MRSNRPFRLPQSDIRELGIALPRSRRSPIVGIVVLILIGLGISSRPAIAGCRVAEPSPTFGRMLDSLTDSVGSATPRLGTDVASRLVPRPCRDETPSSSPGVVVPLPTDAILPIEARVPKSSDHRPGLADDRPAIADRAARLDRPPRDGSPR